MVELSREEADEVERFRERRELFGGTLKVTNIHNVPSQFPVMYKKMFHTNSVQNTLFGRPWLSDGDDSIIKLYEEALSCGYTIKQ